MNLSQFGNLKGGDKVRFVSRYTPGNVYTVRDTPVGIMIDNDNGFGMFPVREGEFYWDLVEDGD